MKHPDYDWMLFGCHPISDIAMAYCPCDTPLRHTRFPQTVETLSEALRRTLQERLHGTFHHPDPSAYSCRDSRIGNAVRSVLRKAETRFQKTPDIF